MRLLAILAVAVGLVGCGWDGGPERQDDFARGFAQGYAAGARRSSVAAQWDSAFTTAMLSTEGFEPVPSDTSHGWPARKAWWIKALAESETLYCTVGRDGTVTPYRKRRPR